MTDPASIARVDQDIREKMGDVAINKWIDGPYMKYVKRDMATPEDPLRALAEQGKLHFNPFTRGEGSEMALAKARRRQGFPAQGLGVSDVARRYEQLADEAVNVFPAGPLQHPNVFTRDNPWMMDVPPETKLYQYNDLTANSTGLTELSNAFVGAFRQGDKLPAHLQLTPEKLQNMSMEKASRYVNELNTYKATEEARRARELFDQAPTVREYGEAGYKWKHLDAPHLEGAERDKFITDILKYEGDTLNHCVGGYCEDVRDGITKIYSLRDKNGKPHVTIEVTPVGKSLKDEFDWINGVANDEAEYITMMTDRLKKNNLPVVPAETGPEFYQLNKEVIEQPEKFLPGGGITHEITQVKGGNNSRPKDEYQEYITDFIKNPPLPNMKLVDDFSKTNFLDNYEMTRLRKPYELNFGPQGIDTQSVKFDVPEGHYTKADIRELLNAQRPAEINDDIWEGFMRRWTD